MDVRYVKRVVFSTDDTAVPVQIVWPDPLTPHELVDLKDCIAIWLRGLERRTAGASSDPTTGNANG